MKSVLAGLLLLPLSAFAVDGVREINQICANGFGCFAGDNGGFPVQITESGSYRLTSDLDVSALSNPENRTAIDLSNSALEVTIDLNGFSIIGPATCTGTPVTSCTPTGTGDGIRTPVATNAAVTIKNGTIRGMGDTGIACGRNCIISNIHAVENAGFGFGNANGDSIIINNILRRNGGSGMSGAGLIESNIAIGNGGDGIFSNPGSRVIGNQSEDNDGNGIRCFTCSLINNVIRANTGFGVSYGGRAVAGGNLIDDNDMGEIDGTAPFEIAPNRCGFSAC